MSKIIKKAKLAAYKKDWYETRKKNIPNYSKLQYQKHKKAHAAYRKKNSKIRASYSKKWREENQDKYKTGKKKYRENNKEKISAYGKQYKKVNAGKINSLIRKRQQQKTKAAPSWLTKEDFNNIEAFYIAAKEMQLLARCSLHIDHIIPLLGKNVCGLHVPWNLQLLTAEENIAKGNKLNV